MKDQETSLASDEGDDEQVDAPQKKRKGWEKFWGKFKSEVGNKSGAKPKN